MPLFAHTTSVCANVASEQGACAAADKTLVPPFVIQDRMVTDGNGNSHPIKVGMIGFVPPQVMNWDRRHLEGNVQARDIVDTARALVPLMKEQGADIIIIALSHSGNGGADHVDGMENAFVPQAAMDGIDTVLTGHHHQVFPSPSYADMSTVDVAAGTIHGKSAAMSDFCRPLI